MVITKVESEDAEIALLDDGYLVVDYMNDEPVFALVKASNHERIELSLDVSVNSMFRFENRLFAVTDRGLSELQLTNLGKHTISYQF